MGVQQQVSAGMKGRSMAPPPFTLNASAAQPAQLTAQPKGTQEELEGDNAVVQRKQENGQAPLQLKKSGNNRPQGQRRGGQNNRGQAQGQGQRRGGQNNQGQAQGQAQAQQQGVAPVGAQTPAPAQNNPVNAPANNNANANNNNAAHDNDNDNENVNNNDHHNDNDAIQDEEQRREEGPVSCVAHSYSCESGVVGEHVTFSNGVAWSIKKHPNGGFVYMEVRNDPDNELSGKKVDFNFPDNKNWFSSKEVKAHFHQNGIGKYWSAFWEVTTLKSNDNHKLKTYAQERK